MTGKRAPSAPIWGLALIVPGLGAPAMAREVTAAAPIIQLL
jgi:hypothetical protein